MRARSQHRCRHSRHQPRRQPIYPAAEALSARGIPFVFSTGYEASAIDQRNSGIAVLQKPIDEQMLRSALFACMARSEAGHGKEPVS